MNFWPNGVLLNLTSPLHAIAKPQKDTRIIFRTCEKFALCPMLVHGYPVLGIDIGGSSVKGAIVDAADGKLSSKRIKIKHQKSPDLEKIIDSIFKISKKLDFSGDSVGIGFPGVVEGKTVVNGPNMGLDLVGDGLCNRLSSLFNNISLLNDADSALYHAIRNTDSYKSHDRVLLVTIGTSLGTAFSQNGKLITNIELGQIMNESGTSIDLLSSDSARRELGLDFDEWASELTISLRMLSKITSPSLILLGGGVTTISHKWLKMLDLEIENSIVPDGNEAGIIGAACWNHDLFHLF